MEASSGGPPDEVKADFDLFFLKTLTTEAQVKKLMREEKIFKKIKYSAGMDSSLGRSFASFVVASDKLQLLNGQFTYEIKQKPAGYLSEMRNRDFQSRMENLFGKTNIKFYFRATTTSDRLIPMRLSPDQKITISGISFGSLIDMHTFVEHVDFVKHEDKKLEMKTSRFKNDLYVRFLNGKNRINVYFKLYSPHSYQQHYKLTLDYEGINFVVVSPGEEKDQNGRFVKYLDVVICYLKAPLLMFCAITDGDNTKPQRYKHDYKSSAVEDGVGKWMRCLSVPGVDNDSFGRSTVLKLRMPSIKEYQNEAVFDMIKTDPLDILSCLSYFAGCPIYWSKVETTSSKAAFDLKPLMKAEMISDQFPVQYALQGIFSVSHYVSDFLTLTVNGEKAGEKCKKFSKLIRTCAFKHPKALEDTLFEAFRVLERTSALDILEFLPKEFDRLCSNPHYPTDPGKGVIMIRRVFITPSRVICAPPERQLASWFLSKLEQDCLIRLYFRDDNMESYTFTCNPQKHNGRDGKSSWKIMMHERVFHPVVNGLTIASKTFEFLVCSSSMLRSHALMMYAKDRFGFSAAHYQDEIGDVKQKIKTVAKYIARSGQAISQPIGRVKEEPSRVHFSYPDVIKYDEKTRLKKYTFTDGIGMMSAEVATNAAKAMNWKIVPSALQMRYGGAKGVVAVDPRLPNLPGHPGKHLILRDSMVKFASQSDSLEILKPSLLRPIHLNKSFIMVLDQLGVGEEVFMELLLKQLNMACESFLSEAAALKTLKGYTALHIPLNIKKILDNESMINVLREPFFRKCLGVVTNEMVLELKSKARIKLPLDAGRHMLGVTDESGLLQEGQVFVQYAKFNSTFTSDVKQHEWEILEGEILVTKAPTMVTGDVRKFKAVNIPQLHHHRDVVVFAQKGERPDPDKMAGSDLDGDEYAVIWYKPLIFKGPNRDPLDYTCVKEQQDKEINTQSIMKYIMQYMERDSIGLIATTHLARSDRDRDGTDRTNQGLALKYTKALDAVKTGVYQTILPHEKSLIHPDFMGKEAHGPTYVSERVLGTIYRHVCLYEMTVCDYVTVQPLEQANELLVHKDWERFRGSAEGSLQKYSAMIHSLLKQYKVEDEASLLTQSFAAQSNGRELRDYRKTIDMQVREIMKAMRDDFEYQFNDKEEGAEKESMKQAKASAWYVVTQQASLKETDCPVLGLPWIVGEYLADLSLEDPLRRSNPTTIIQEMSDQLDKSLTKDMAQKSLEDRIDEAMKILAKWMEYQGHLQFLSTREQENCLSQVQVVLNEIGLAYRINPVLEVPTVGYLIILTMIQMAKPVLERTSVRGFSHENYEIEKPLNFSFLQSLVKLFRSGDAAHVLTDRFPMPKSAASFYLGIESKFTDSFEKFNMYQQNFHKLIRRVAGVDEVESSFENFNRKVRINAYGFKWNLIQLRMILAQDKFLAYLLDKLDQKHQAEVLESEERYGCWTTSVPTHPPK